MTETMVKKTRTKQYWKTPIQTTCSDVSAWSSHPNHAATHIEPSQTTFRPSQYALVLSTGTFLKTKDGPEPVYGYCSPEIVFLLVQIGRNVVAEEGEEGSNGESLIAVTDHFKVNIVGVEEVRQEGDDAVDGQHEDNTDDTGEK